MGRHRLGRRPPPAEPLIGSSEYMGPDGTVWQADEVQLSGTRLRSPVLSSWDGISWETRGLPLYGVPAGVSAHEAVVVGYPNNITPPFFARTCTTEVTATGVRRPGTTVHIDAPALVRDESGLSTGLVLVDRLGLFPRTRFTGQRPASYRYPGAGTFQAQVRGVPGLSGAAATVTTAVLPYVYSNGGFPVNLVVGAVTPQGWQYEVQAKVPGTASFRTVSTQTSPTLSLRQSKPNPGVWEYRSRMVRIDGTAQSGWSPSVAITR